MAYDLVNFLCSLATRKGIETWWLTSTRARLIGSASRLVRHARYAVFQFCEAAL